MVVRVERKRVSLALSLSVDSDSCCSLSRSFLYPFPNHYSHLYSPPFMIFLSLLLCSSSLSLPSTALKRYDRVRQIREKAQFEETLAVANLTDKYEKLSKDYQQALGEMHYMRNQLITMVNGDTYQELEEKFEKIEDQLQRTREAYNTLNNEYQVGDVFYLL